jgi:hypothetical protein
MKIINVGLAIELGEEEVPVPVELAEGGGGGNSSDEDKAKEKESQMFHLDPSIGSPTLPYGLAVTYLAVHWPGNR